MRITRIYYEGTISCGERIILPESSSHHISHVLRMRDGEKIRLFNGTDGYFISEIQAIKKRQIEVMPETFVEENRESPLRIYLIQAISRSRHMDYAIQKSVELGVTTIVPLITERINASLREKQTGKRLGHWKKIIISACEQCGRNRLPVLMQPVTLENWIEQDNNPVRLILAPNSDTYLPAISPVEKQLSILSGAEGGFSDAEMKYAVSHGFVPISLGPRILRTETAAVAAVSACQALWGDMG